LSRELNELCAALARDPRIELVASASVPSNGFWAFLEPGDVPLRLYRIRASAEPAARTDWDTQVSQPTARMRVPASRSRR